MLDLTIQKGENPISWQRCFSGDWQLSKHVERKNISVECLHKGIMREAIANERRPNCLHTRDDG